MNRHFKFEKSGQLFISTHNEALTVIAMRVSNPDRPSVGINRCDTAPTPTGLLGIVNRMQSPTQSATRNSTAAHMML
jgi:hypothetical protein